mgnify:CR=1 FL=1
MRLRTTSSTKRRWALPLSCCQFSAAAAAIAAASLPPPLPLPLRHPRSSNTREFATATNLERESGPHGEKPAAYICFLLGPSSHGDVSSALAFHNCSALLPARSQLQARSLRESTRLPA